MSGIKELELKIIDNKKANVVFELFHYLHRARSGPQINYLIKADNENIAQVRHFRLKLS